MNGAHRIGFIGGGNMALAILGGLRRAGMAAADAVVVEPSAAQRERLHEQCGIVARAAADSALTDCGLIVWAVKPQSFAEAAAASRDWVAQALHLSIMAGVRCATIESATGATSIVRAMPNTPALIGRGIAALYAAPVVSDEQRARAERVLQAAGSVLWVGREEDLDAVTALSGSGPAYVFYLLEAMVQAGTEMGLPPQDARRLAQETFAGAAELAMRSEEPLATLRERVTSRGGTTHAAITSLDASGVAGAFVRALHAARRRAEELGRG